MLPVFPLTGRILLSLFPPPSDGEDTRTAVSSLGGVDVAADWLRAGQCVDIRFSKEAVCSSPVTLPSISRHVTPNQWRSMREVGDYKKRPFRGVTPRFEREALR